MKFTLHDPATMISSVEALGVQRIEIAHAAKVSPSTITRLASGEFRRPSHETVMKLHAACERLGDLRTRK